MTMAPVIIRNMVQVAVQTWVAATLPALRALTRPVWRALTRRAAGLLDKAEIHQKGGGEISDIGSLDPTQFAVAPRGKGRTVWRERYRQFLDTARGEARGLMAAVLSRARVRLWHFSDIPPAPMNVRYRE